jgi:hypothetical protein
MKTKKLEKDLKEHLKEDDYQDFFKFLGIDPEDFKDFENDINFDDYSN